MSHEQRASACPACGVDWANHLGIVGTCAENKRLRVQMRKRRHPLNEMRDCPECGLMLKWSGNVAVCRCGSKIIFKRPKTKINEKDVR